VTRRHRRRTRFLNGLGSSPLKLTSMMDIMVTLLFFVLKAFVVDGEAVTVAPGLELPHSTSQSQPAESIPVAILDHGILVGDEMVASTDAVRDQPDLWVASLGTKLEAARKQSEEIARLRGEEPPRRSVIIQGDRDLEYKILEKVMYTVDRAGYRNVSLAVIAAPRGDAG
jgi:biopolymer transport protein ExbD